MVSAEGSHGKIYIVSRSGMPETFLKWDPCWGPESKVFYLGAHKGKKPFWMAESALYSGKKLIYKPSEGRLCAGSFENNLYFGSSSFDFWHGDKQLIGQQDQQIFVLDMNWKKLASLRASDIIRGHNRYFSNLMFNNKMFIAFRDPAKMPYGNFAVCTGGHRWNTHGNLCEVKYDGATLRLVNETILDESMMYFTQIERPTFWNEFMFFSVNGGTSKDRCSKLIHCAKVKANGTYRYYGYITGSDGFYGPNLNSEGKLIYWYRRFFRLSNPSFTHLAYTRTGWKIADYNPRYYILKTHQRLKKNLTTFNIYSHRAKAKLKSATSTITRRV